MIEPVSDESAHQAQRVVNRLKAIREAKEITQAQLAQQAGITREVLARIETGQRARGLTLEEAFALADALDVDLKRLADPEPMEIATKRKRIE